ncbi:helix-turn-helix domain-containing protein [Nonomuraea sp. NPDC049646]|uniref:helix-turn-helix domain-containing protein n=1 Tax=unclassified Nonomuraea TaxID=2593643 RepID=UPI0037AF3534
MATLVLRRDKFDAYRRLAGLTTDVDLAARLGVNATTVYRVLSGKTAMSARFIAGVVDVFGPDLFADLFIVAPTTASRHAADAHVEVA